MRLALLADIHGNREALAAVLADLSGRAIGRIAVLGDIVGYGPDPEWCVDRLRALDGAMVIKGNHDSAIDHPGEVLNAPARAVIDWTRERLGTARRAWLAALPMTAAEGDTLFVHANAHEPAAWVYVRSDSGAKASFHSTRARITFCGHAHRAQLYSCDRQGVVREQVVTTGQAVPLIRSRRWLGVVGSVGQARDGVPQASYAVYDMETAELSFLRVPYDVAATVGKMRAAALPEALATRLLKGQ